MLDKGHALNERVWKLFDKLGFDTKPNWNDPAEEQIVLASGKKRTLDLYAVDKLLGVKLIGWNKARSKLTESLTTHLHDYETLKKKVGAQAMLFVATEIDIGEDDRAYAEKLGARIWSEDELKYYETLVDTVGKFAKYEVIHALGLRTKEERRTFHVLAIHMRQPFPDSETDLFLFTAPPAFLLRTSVVLRKASGNRDAYQRIVQRKRLLQIRKFVAKADSLLPPNIIVHLGENVSWSAIDMPTKASDGKPINLSRSSDYELVSLNIPAEYASMEVIDGQHRLFAFAHTEPATRKTFNLVVAGIANLNRKRRTETFVAINDNARRMDPSLVAYLKYDPDEKVCQADQELMAIKLVVELNKMSPFKGKIRLLDIGEQRITLKGFAGYDLKGLLGPRGQLRKYHPHQSAEYVKTLRIYFGVLKDLFPKQWQDPDRYIIFTNRGIAAFLKLLKSILRTTEGPLTLASARKYLQSIRSHWADPKWDTQTLRSGYIGSGGWKDFHRDLVKSIRKDYKSFKE